LFAAVSQPPEKQRATAAECRRQTDARIDPIEARRAIRILSSDTITASARPDK